MIDKEDWGFNPNWLDYVNQTWIQGKGRVQQQHEPTGCGREFFEKAKESFANKGLFNKHLKIWVSIQEPNTGEGYEKGYPHIHYPLKATTLVHYLEPGDIPAPLDIFEGEEVIETIYPERGLTVFMPNNKKHGVRINKGTTNRIQMIATAL